MARFVVQLAFTDHDRRLDVRPAHREHLRRLHAAGKLLAAGPWADDSGALLVYEVADRAELDELMAADPYTPAGVCEVTQIREWTPILP